MEAIRDVCAWPRGVEPVSQHGAAKCASKGTTSMCVRKHRVGALCCGISTRKKVLSSTAPLSSFAIVMAPWNIHSSLKIRGQPTKSETHRVKDPSRSFPRSPIIGDRMVGSWKLAKLESGVAFVFSGFSFWCHCGWKCDAPTNLGWMDVRHVARKCGTDVLNFFIVLRPQPRESQIGGR